MLVLKSTHIQRARQFYQDANIGPTIENIQFTASIGKPMVYLSIQTASVGWTIPDNNDLKKVHM